MEQSERLLKSFEAMRNAIAANFPEPSEHDDSTRLINTAGKRAFNALIREARALLEGFPFEQVNERHWLSFTEHLVVLESIISYLSPSRTVNVSPIWRARDIAKRDDLCFVLMPFTDERALQNVYRDHVCKVLDACGLKAERSDDMFDNQQIIEDVWRSICAAKLVIAELTGRNANVFYELGVAHAIGRQSIMITQDPRDVPFDLRHLRFIAYEYTPPGMSKFERELAATVRNVMGYRGSQVTEG